MRLHCLVLVFICFTLVSYGEVFGQSVKSSVTRKHIELWEMKEDFKARMRVIETLSRKEHEEFKAFLKENKIGRMKAFHKLSDEKYEIFKKRYPKIVAARDPESKEYYDPGAPTTFIGLEIWIEMGIYDPMDVIERLDDLKIPNPYVDNPKVLEEHIAKEIANELITDFEPTVIAIEEGYERRFGR